MFARSIRTMFAAALVTLSVVPAAAFADSSPTNSGDATTHVRQDKKAVFPMPTATFRAKVEKRMAKSRDRVTDHMAKKNLPADKQKAVLAKFDEGSVKVLALVDKVGADGTITADEAQQVRDYAKELRGHREHKHDTQARK